MQTPSQGHLPLRVCLFVFSLTLTSALKDNADLDAGDLDLDKRGVKFSVNNGLSALADSMRKKEQTADVEDSQDLLFRLGKRPSFSFNQGLKSVADAYGQNNRENSRAHLLNLGKRVPFSVNSGLQSLADSMRDSNTASAHNRLMSLGKRPSFSVNQGLDTLAAAMGSDRAHNKLLALGKRMQLSFNQGLQSLADSMALSNTEAGRSRLMALGKRATPINNELPSLAYSLRSGAGEAQARLFNLGKQGSNSEVFDNEMQPFGDDESLVLPLKRAPISINNELQSLAQSYGSDNARARLMVLGKRVPLSINQDLMSLASSMKGGRNDAANSLLRGLGKRSPLSIGQELKSLSNAYANHRMSESQNKLLHLGKRLSLSINREMQTLGDAMRHGQAASRLMDLGKRFDDDDQERQTAEFVEEKRSVPRLSVNSELWSLAEMGRDARSHQDRTKGAHALLEHLGKRSS